MNSTDIYIFFFSLCHDDILYVTMALGYPVELQYRCCSGLCNPSPTSSPFCVGMTNWICPSIKMPQWLVLLPLLLILFVQGCLGPAPKRVYEESAFARGQDRRSKTGQRNRIDTLEAFLGLANGFRTVG